MRGLNDTDYFNRQAVLHAFFAAIQAKDYVKVERIVKANPDLKMELDFYLDAAIARTVESH